MRFAATSHAIAALGPCLCLISCLAALTRPAFAQPGDDATNHIYDGDLAAVTKLLDEGLSPDAKDEEGNTLLATAAMVDEVEIAKLLIARGANVNAREAEWGVPVLNNACYWGNEELVELLLKKGADPGQIDKYGGNALEDAAFAGSAELVAKLKGLGLKSRWPLHIAAGLGDLEEVKRLGADPSVINQPRLGWKTTPLAFAAGAGQLEVAEWLLEAGADPNLPDSVELFPLHYAAEDGSLKLCEALIRGGADVNARIDDIESALDYAEDEEVAELLKQHGAKPADELPEGPSLVEWWKDELLRQMKRGKDSTKPATN